MAPLVAVTGATGFLGRYIIRSLVATGWRVRILTRTDPDHPLFHDLELEAVPGDLFNADALRKLTRGTDAVIHAAGAIKAVNTAEFHRVNTLGTVNLLDAITDTNPDVRLLLISSLAAREPHLSAYARSKHAAETAVSERRCGKSWLILRPCAIYGPWDRETLVFFKAINRHLFPSFGHADARLGMVFAEDAANAVAALCTSSLSGAVLEICDNRTEGYDWAEIRATAEDAMGKRAITLPVPAFAIRFAAHANEAAARLTGRPAMLVPGKAREVLHLNWGSAPQALPPQDIWAAGTDLYSGFKTTVDWYREHGWLGL